MSDQHETTDARARARTPEQREEWRVGFLAALDGEKRDAAWSEHRLQGWDDAEGQDGE